MSNYHRCSKMLNIFYIDRFVDDWQDEWLMEFNAEANLPDQLNMVWGQTLSIPIEYCPWCGKNLKEAEDDV